MATAADMNGHLTRAEELLLAGDPSGAVTSYRSALELDPDNADTLEHLGDALIEAGETDEALEVFDEGASLAPDRYNEIDWNLRADRVFGAGRYAAAELFYQRGIDITPNVNGLRGQGLARQQMGQIEGALAKYEEALGIEPGNEILMNDKGVMLIRLGDLNAAKEVFDEVVILNPSYIFGWINTGYIAFSENRFEDAHAAYTTGLQIDPNRADTWIELGRSDLALGNNEPALASFNKAIELDPENTIWGWNNAGHVLGELGRHEEAIEHFDKAIAINPAEMLPWENKILRLTQMGRFTEAEDCINDALPVVGDLARAKQLKAMILTEWLGRNEEAMELLDAAAALNPDSVDIGSDRAELLLKVGRYPESRRQARKLLEGDLDVNVRCALLFIAYATYTMGGGSNAARFEAYDDFISFFRGEFVEGENPRPVAWTYDGLINVVRESGDVSEAARLMLLTAVDMQTGKVDPKQLTYFDLADSEGARRPGIVG